MRGCGKVKYRPRPRPPTGPRAGPALGDPHDAGIRRHPPGVPRDRRARLARAHPGRAPGAAGRGPGGLPPGPEAPPERLRLPLPLRRAEPHRPLGHEARRPRPRSAASSGRSRPRSPASRSANTCRGWPGVMDKVCLLRSMTHRMNVHGPACSEVFSGRPYFGPPTTDQASREDWPSLASMVARYGPPRRRAAAVGRAALVPAVPRPGRADRRADRRPHGRAAQRRSSSTGDLGRADFELEGLDLPDGRAARPAREPAYAARPASSRPAARGPAAEAARRRTARPPTPARRAAAADAFDLRREPRAVRERYGQTAVGQSLLLARRLVEAGVSLVTVNWQDETKTDGVNTCWDTHQDNFPKLKTCSARSSTGRSRRSSKTWTSAACWRRRWWSRSASSAARRSSASSPRARNTQKTGRDHWPHAFTALLAGGGVRGGQVYGATTPRRRLRQRQAGHAGRPDGDDPAPPGDRPPPRVRGRVPAPAQPAQRRPAGDGFGVTLTMAYRPHLLAAIALLSPQRAESGEVDSARDVRPVLKELLPLPRRTEAGRGPAARRPRPGLRRRRHRPRGRPGEGRRRVATAGRSPSTRRCSAARGAAHRCGGHHPPRVGRTGRSLARRTRGQRACRGPLGVSPAEAARAVPDAAGAMTDIDRFVLREARAAPSLLPSPRGRQPHARSAGFTST